MRYRLPPQWLTIRPFAEQQARWVLDRLYRIAHPFKDTAGRQQKVRVRPPGWGL